MNGASDGVGPAVALFVIDVQVDLAQDPATQIADATELRATLSTVLHHVRSVNAGLQTPHVRLVFVQHNDRDADDALAMGKPGWQLVFAPLTADGDWLVHKSDRNVFASNATLARRLLDAGIRQLVMCGAQTECCVRSSTLGAIENGFEDVIVLSGAHSTYPIAAVGKRQGQTLEQLKHKVESQLAEKGAKIVPCHAWIAQIKQVVGQDENERDDMH